MLNFVNTVIIDNTINTFWFLVYLGNICEFRLYLVVKIPDVHFEFFINIQ